MLNFAINAWCDATCLQDMELRRNDEVFWDSIGADALPDPTTAGDFCRRFDESSQRDLHDAIDDARLNVWKRQSPDFFDEAVIDLDGTLVVTTGECKEGLDISYQGGLGLSPARNEPRCFCFSSQRRLVAGWSGCGSGRLERLGRWPNRRCCAKRSAACLAAVLARHGRRGGRSNYRFSIFDF